MIKKRNVVHIADIPENIQECFRRYIRYYDDELTNYTYEYIDMTDIINEYWNVNEKDSKIMIDFMDEHKISKFILLYSW